MGLGTGFGPGSLIWDVDSGAEMILLWTKAFGAVVTFGALCALFPVTALATTAVLDFGGSTVSSTLANDGTGEIRWQGITTVGGASADLVATVTGGNYEAADLSKNGLSGEYGQINLLTNHDARFHFALLDTVTQASVSLVSFDFVVFDLDEGNNGKNRESVQMLSSGSFTMTTATEISIDNSDPAGPIFRSSTPGIGSDNPTSPTTLTAQQQNRSVEFSFEGVNNFDLDFGVAGPAEAWGRNFIFAGVVGFTEDTTTTVVPEPGTALLVALGLVGLATRRRR